MKIKILNIRFEINDTDLKTHSHKEDLAKVYIGKIIEIGDQFHSSSDNEIEKILCKIISHETGWMVFNVNFKILDNEDQGDESDYDEEEYDMPNRRKTPRIKNDDFDM